MTGSEADCEDPPDPDGTGKFKKPAGRTEIYFLFLSAGFSEVYSSHPS